MSKIIWNKYQMELCEKQPLPEINKWVLIQCESEGVKCPTMMMAGYLKNAGNNKNRPYFVIPGHLGAGRRLSWCDCLADNFEPPMG